MKGGEAARKRNSLSCAKISGRISRAKLLNTKHDKKIFRSLSFTSCSRSRNSSRCPSMYRNQSGYSMPASPDPFAVGASSLI